MGKTTKGKPKPKMYGAFAITDTDVFARMRATCEVCVLPDEDFTTPSALLNKNMKLQRGGLCTVLLTKCSAPAFDETDLAAVQASINAGDTIVIRDCTINGTFGQEATTVTRGCNADTIVTNRTNTLTVVDASDNDDFDRAKLYNYLQNNQNAFRVAVITYDVVLLFPSRRATANPLRNVAENTDGFNEVTTTFVWRELALPIPAKLAWSPDDLTLPACTVRIQVVAIDGSDYSLLAVPTLAPGATGYSVVWKVNGVVEVGATDLDYTFTGLVASDAVTVEITDNSVGGCLAISEPYVVPA